jgi:23S rRNA (uracil1939-C5)-methyltransferase
LGQKLELEVTDMALDGDAIGRVGGYVVLVAEAIPGERVEARVLSSNRKFARAEKVRVIRPSPHRVTARCKHFGPCGGCTWQHIAYAKQLRLKEEMLRATLEHALKGIELRLEPTIGIDRAGGAGGPSWPSDGSPPRGPLEGREAPWGFRNKVHFAFAPAKGNRGLVMGHYRRGSKDLIEVDECPVHSEKGNDIAFRLRDLLRKHAVPGTEEGTLRGLARHVVVRTGERTMEPQATIVTTRSQFPALKKITQELFEGRKGPDGFHLNVNDRPGPYLFGRTTRTLRGAERLCDEVAGTKFLISPTTFFQTSVRSAEKLVQVVLSFVPENDPCPILDLYAGCGLFSIPLARRGQRVVAIEENPVAVGDGIASLKLNRVPPDACRFLRSRVEDALRHAASGRPEERQRFAMVIMDPPREGCPEEVMGVVLWKLRPEKIVYVSCNPRTLATDLILATKAGYKIERVQPVDMFPHTAHIESVTLLGRKMGSSKN